MYEVDSQDEVIELDAAPQPDVGAPLPLVLADESHLLLAYLVHEPDPKWDGTYTTMVSPESEGMSVACISFQRKSAHMFGPPGDEAFGGHPLASRGLHPYGIFEILHSSWIRKLEEMNSVHPKHDQQRFMAGKRHFIFAFHDSTFECIARGLDVRTSRGSMISALKDMTSLLSEKLR